MPNKTVTTVAYREELLRSLKNPQEAAAYLNACLEDSDPRVFLMALRDVADARGGIRALSRGARLNRESLYRMLSTAGNPSLESLNAVRLLDADSVEVGIHLRATAETERDDGVHIRQGHGRVLLTGQSSHTSSAADPARRPCSPGVYNGMHRAG